MPEIENENLGAIENEEQADALLESIEAPSDAPIQDEKPQAPQVVDEFELTVGGKAIKAKRDQVLQWAQMGYDAPNKIRGLTKEIETWKQKENQFKEIESKYGDVDKYVRQNPQFWDHVLKSYEQRNQLLQDTSNPMASVIQQLQTQVQDLVQKNQAFENERSQAQIKQEDQAYSQTMEEIQKAYPDIDFVTPDAEGKSLEYKVLEYAQNEGIRNFKTAFRDFYHDELVKRSESRAKEDLAKQKQKNTKLGILGIAPTPTKKTSSDHRGKSYDDLASEALEELGIR